MQGLPPEEFTYDLSSAPGVANLLAEHRHDSPHPIQVVHHEQHGATERPLAHDLYGTSASQRGLPEPGSSFNGQARFSPGPCVDLPPKVFAPSLQRARRNMLDRIGLWPYRNPDGTVSKPNAIRLLSR